MGLAALVAVEEERIYCGIYCGTLGCDSQSRSERRNRALMRTGAASGLASSTTMPNGYARVGWGWHCRRVWRGSDCGADVQDDHFYVPVWQVTLCLHAQLVG